MNIKSNVLYKFAGKCFDRLSPVYQGSSCFSQEGEDMILAGYFGWKSSGFYVDVGAHHPVRYSNTYSFYLRGWRGLNIDAMPGSMDEFRRLRPRDCNIEALVSNKSDALTYYMFSEPAMNTCDPELAHRNRNLVDCSLIGTKVITPQTLGSVLDANLVESSLIDFMSIDVEGLDLDALESNNWKKYRPEVILTEDYGQPNIEKLLLSPTTLFLKKHGYVFFAKTLNTLFFRNEQRQPKAQ